MIRQNETQSLSGSTPEAENERENDRYGVIGALAKRLMQGDMACFDEFYRETKRMVFFELKSAGVDQNEIEDVMQDVYMKCLGNLKSLRDPKAVYKWLKLLAYRTGINHCLSSVSRHEELATEEAYEHQFESEGNLNAPLPLPEDIMENKESQRMIREILRALPEQQYKMIVGFYYNECSVKEIAEMMNVSESTVKTNLFRARNEIKTQVETLEKKHGIRLHSVAVAPLLFFLFGQEAKAATVGVADQVMTGKILSDMAEMRGMQAAGNAAKTAGNAAAKTAGGKTASRGIAFALAAFGGVAAVLIVLLLFTDIGSAIVPWKQSEEAAIGVQDEGSDVAAAAIAEDDTELPDEMTPEEPKETNAPEDISEPAQPEPPESEGSDEDADPENTISEDLTYSGQITFDKNNHDGTYMISRIVFDEIDGAVIENAQIGDKVESVYGKTYEIIDATYATGLDREKSEKFLKKGKFDPQKAAMEEGSDISYDGYYLKKGSNGNYKLYWPENEDEGYCASLRAGGSSILVEDDAVMSLEPYPEGMQITLTGAQFKEIDGIAKEVSEEEYYSYTADAGNTRIEFAAAGFFYGMAEIREGKLVSFRQLRYE